MTTPINYQAIAAQAARSEGLNPALFVRQINQESGFQVAPSGRDAQGNILPNSSGAAGIAQVVAKYHPDAPPASDPVGQIKWMAKYMAGLVQQHGGWAPALSVYNSGNEHAWKDPNFANGQTYNYVRDILGNAHSEVRNVPPTPVPPGTPGAPASPLAPTPLTTPDITSRLQAQGRANLSAIANGTEQPEDSLAHTASLMQTLKASAASMPQVAIPTAAQGGSKLESQAANLVKKYLGVKYTWGGTSAATGFDCSGLVQSVWKQLGVNVPRTTWEQMKAGKPVAAADLKPGDALFFNNGEHEGMYIGNGKFIEAPHTGASVRISDLAGYPGFVGARRFA